MFLDTWEITLSVYEYFILSFIFLILLCILWDFQENIVNFVLKIIYLSILVSHVGLDIVLDYDNINIILLLFQKQFSTFFFPFGIVPLVFLKGKIVTIFIFSLSLFYFILNCSFYWVLLKKIYIFFLVFLILW